MSHIWNATLSITSALAKELIESQTSILVSNIETIGAGFDNIAYLINREFVFRFPRRETGMECMENEIMILPYLKDKLSFPFSCPEYIGKPTVAYPAFFSGYRLLQGTPLSETTPGLISDKKFAEKLALWLKELHSVPVLEDHKNRIKGDQSWRLNVQERIIKTRSRIESYQEYLLDAGFDIQALMQATEQLENLNFDHVKNDCYIQGDLYSRHILVNDYLMPCGLIDWGDIHIGHPGNDLSIGIMILSPEIREYFFQVYASVDQETRDIAVLRVFCHSIILLAYCYETNQESLKQWTILALQQALNCIRT